MSACSREVRSSRMRMSASAPRPRIMCARRRRKSRPISAPRRTTREACAFLKRPLSRVALSMAIVMSCGRSGMGGPSGSGLDADTVAAGFLGPVERPVGAAAERSDVPSVLGTGGDADADGDGGVRAVQGERLTGDSHAGPLRGLGGAEQARFGEIGDELL